MPADTQQLTPWFDGSVKPTRIGWHQRDYEDPSPLYSTPDYWDGSLWRVGSGVDAIPSPRWRAIDQKLPWRGLKEPSK